jgi:tetratricopeptide (TPR) repeat protein
MKLNAVNFYEANGHQNAELRNKMKRIKISFITPWTIATLFAIALSLSSCKKFLASYSQNKTFVETAADLDELLIGEAYFRDQASWPLFLMDDDVEMGIPFGTGQITFEFSSTHFWQPNPRITSEGSVISTDGFFNKLYRNITSANVILYNIPLLKEKNEPADTLRRISGECHFLRAYFNFMLVNMYGKPYQQSTAATDFGIPLRNDPTVKDGFFTRNTVKEVYDQIIKDLSEAEKELEGFNQLSIIRANQAAVQALLSRVYLFMEDYENSILYADKVINTNNYQIFDLNQYAEGAEFATRSNPENIFTSGTTLIGVMMHVLTDAPIGESYQTSDDLVMNYAQQDLRLNAFFKQTSQGYIKSAKKRLDENSSITDASDTWWLRVSELYLNKAEALAILGRDAEAINALQELRKNRFKPEDMTDIALTGAELVGFIRDERRREFSFESHRWFDLRRYGVNAKYPYSKTIRHISYANSENGFYQNGYYELKPYDQDKAAYVFPIAADEIEFNRGQLINEDRPERPLIQ